MPRDCDNYGTLFPGSCCCCWTCYDRRVGDAKDPDFLYKLSKLSDIISSINSSGRSILAFLDAKNYESHGVDDGSTLHGSSRMAVSHVRRMRVDPQEHRLATC